ncbi:hypothetical protein SYNPS1DRAFT_28230, partial [Syncephalis pseudoplumigaleata]
MSADGNNSNNTNSNNNNVMAPLKLEVTSPTVDWQAGKIVDWSSMPAGDMINNQCNTWPMATADLGLHTLPAAVMSSAAASAPTPDATELGWSPAPTTPSSESVLDFKWHTAANPVAGDLNQQDAALGIWLLNFIGDNNATLENINNIYHKLNDHQGHPALMANPSPAMAAAESVLQHTAGATTAAAAVTAAAVSTSPVPASAEQRMPDSEPLVSVMQRLSVQPESPSSQLTLEMARTAFMAQLNASSSPTPTPTPATSLETTPILAAAAAASSMAMESPIGAMQPFYPLALFPADGNTLPIARPGSPSAMGHLPSMAAATSGIAAATMPMQPVMGGAPVAVALNHPNGGDMPGLRLQPVPIHPTAPSYQSQPPSSAAAAAVSSSSMP